jgi:hypothetical protein
VSWSLALGRRSLEILFHVSLIGAVCDVWIIGHFPFVIFEEFDVVFV